MGDDKFPATEIIPTSWITFPTDMGDYNKLLAKSIGRNLVHGVESNPSYTFITLPFVRALHLCIV